MAVTTILSRTNYLAKYAPNSANAADNSRIDERLEAVSQAVMQYLGFEPNDAGDWTVIASTRTYTIRDLEVEDGLRQALPFFPVTAVASVRVGSDTEGTSGTDYDLLTSGTDYRALLTPEDRPSLRWVSGGRRPVEGEEVRVTMTAGWAAAPPALVHAVGTLTARSLARDPTPGISSESAGGVTTTSYDSTQWPSSVKDDLRPFRQPFVRMVRS